MKTKMRKGELYWDDIHKDVVEFVKRGHWAVDDGATVRFFCGPKEDWVFTFAFERDLLPLVTR